MLTIPIPRTVEALGVGLRTGDPHRITHGVHVDDVGQVITGPRCNLAEPAIQAAVLFAEMGSDLKLHVSKKACVWPRQKR